MSGHSKWAKIKRAKGANDAKRGEVFTKLSKAISVAVQEGGADPDSNFTLRLAIQQARKANMPSDNIAKAIKRGSGELGGDRISTIIYEGYSYDGAALLLECQTDNSNRAYTEVRQIVEHKHNGKLSSAGSVSWQFEQRGQIVIDMSGNTPTDDEFILSLLEIEGVVDVELGSMDTREVVVVLCDRSKFAKVNEVVESMKLELLSSELVFVPKEYKELDSAGITRLDALVEDLENSEEINNIWHNAYGQDTGD